MDDDAYELQNSVLKDMRQYCLNTHTYNYNVIILLNRWHAVIRRKMCVCWCVSDGDEILVNEQRGYMLRTKPIGTNEGGLMTSSAFVDSPYLV